MGGHFALDRRLTVSLDLSRGTKGMSATSRKQTLSHLFLAALGTGDEASLFKPFATMPAKTLGSP